MGAMNKQMNLPALSNIMREFDRQNERMEMTSEMMGDAVDDAFEVCAAAKPVCLVCTTCFWRPECNLYEERFVAKRMTPDQSSDIPHAS